MSSLITSPLDLLLPYQREWVDDASRFKLGIWSRQTGKDFSTAAEAVRDAMMRPKAEWMIAAPSERQAMESLNKCKEWSEAFSYAITDEQIDRPDGPGTLMKSGSIQFGNGSRILAVPGKPDTVRGFSANLVLTEFAFFDDPDATWKGVLPSITNPLRGGEKRVRLITTPNGKTGRGAKTYKIYKDNYLEPREGRKQRWNCYKIDIETAVRMGLPVDIEELKEAFDDPDGWEQEFMCGFLDSSNVLLPYDLIALAESPLASLTIEPSYYSADRDIYLGIDFGRTNDPTVCWTLEKEGDVCVTREVLVLRNMSTPDQEEILRHRIQYGHPSSRLPARSCSRLAWRPLGGHPRQARQGLLRHGHTGAAHDIPPQRHHLSRLDRHPANRPIRRVDRHGVGTASRRRQDTQDRRDPRGGGRRAGAHPVRLLPVRDHQLDQAGVRSP